MRNNRGEFNYREPYDKDHYAFTRNSGLRPHDFEDKTQDKDALVGFVAFVVGVIVYVGFAFLGWGNL